MLHSNSLPTVQTQITYEHSSNGSWSIHHFPDSWRENLWCYLVPRKKNHMIHVSLWTWNTSDTGAPAEEPQNTAVAERGFLLLLLCWKLWVPKGTQDPWLEWPRDVAEWARGGLYFLFHLPSQFHSLPHRSPAQCPLRYTCPSLGEEQSWRWHSWDRLQLWKDRRKSVMNWLKI